MTIAAGTLLIAVQLAIGGAVAYYLRNLQQRRTKALEEDLKRAVAALEKEWRHHMDQLERKMKELDEISRVLVPPEPPPSGLNLNKRGHALDLLRRGEDCGRVAEFLSLPRSEVELLRKIQLLLAAQARI